MFQTTNQNNTARDTYEYYEITIYYYHDSQSSKKAHVLVKFTVFHSVVLGVSQQKSFRCLSQAVPPLIRFCCSTHASGDFSHLFQQFCLLWHVISPEEGAHTFPSRGSALHLSCSRWPTKIKAYHFSRT